MASTVQERGLAKASYIYENRNERARALKDQGRKIMGYFCCYPPLEMVTALDFVPYRVFGDMDEPITKADAYLPTVVCPFLRSAFDLGLKGDYDFLDGLVGGHICDVGAHIPQLWRHYIKPPFVYFMDMPHVVHKESLTFFRQTLMSFKSHLEDFTGKEISDERLMKEISVHNQLRSLVRELYDLRRADPPPLSGKEALQVLKALMSIPPEEGIQLLKETIAEVRQRRHGPRGQAARLLIWGSPIDNAALIEAIESVGANVVMDDTCVGTRFYWPDVEPAADPLDGLANRYLVEIKCPRTFRDAGESYRADLENRFGYLKHYAREWKVDGVILQSMKYCDTHGYEVPGVKDYIEGLGLPALFLEHEYTRIAIAPLRTRVQAFVEMIGQGH